MVLRRSFWSEMPDLNLANDEVRSEIEDIASYWLDLGVDGFRLDAAKEYFTGGAKRISKYYLGLPIM